ncbi:uncharacterized protein METZ01_LOCUS133498, partial [marine metagenome]
MTKDSRKSTGWFDAELKKAKDDFAALARGDQTRSGEPAKVKSPAPPRTTRSDEPPVERSP